MPNVKLFSYNKDYMDILKLACSKPYGNDVTVKGVKRIIESGHLSILEHCNAIFDVRCSVRVLGQVTRHRHLHFTAQSARGKSPDKFVDPLTNNCYPLENMTCSLDYFDKLLDEQYALEDAAYYLPQGVETSLVLSGNLRAWYEWLPKRLCKRAMPEHRKLASLIHEELRKAMPEIFDRNFMNCGNCREKSCVFK